MTKRFQLLLLLLLVLPSVGWAQELTPRAYWPAPHGTRVATVGYIYTTGDTLPDPSLPITGVDSRISTLAFGYLQTLNLWGRTANFVVELPVADGETSTTHDTMGFIERDYQGVGDIAATLAVNFMGAPSMNEEEFAELRRNPRPILAGSLRLVAPTGKYDSDSLINVGANRWALKAELGYMTVLQPKWLLEFELGSWFFGDNDDLLGMKKKQSPIYAVEAHLVHRFSPGFWASLDWNYYKGGRSKLDGVRLDDLQRDSKMGFTLVFPMAHKHAIKLGYSNGSLNDSDESFEAYTASYQWLF